MEGVPLQAFVICAMYILFMFYSLLSASPWKSSPRGLVHPGRSILTTFEFIHICERLIPTDIEANTDMSEIRSRPCSGSAGTTHTQFLYGVYTYHRQPQESGS